MSDPITNDSRADRMSDAAYDSDLDDTTMDFDSRPTQEDDTYHGEEEDKENEDDTAPLTILTTGTTSPLTTMTLTQIALLPEYPQTSVNGYTFCVHVDPKRATPELVLQDALQFQYCRKQKGPAKRTSSQFLGGQAMRYRYECTGVKRCEYLDNSLATLSHTHVTSETWEQMRNSRLNIYRTERDELCTLLLLGVFTVVLHAQIRRSPAHQFFAKCDTRRFQGFAPERHFYRAVGDKYNVEYLQNPFENGLPHELEQRDTCGVVLSTRTKLKDCDVDHPQGKGKLVRVLCGVTFNIIIPFDLQECPYYLFTSHGIHSHPPPPPTKTPEALTQEIVALIRRANDPSLTVATFLKSSFLDEFCQKHNKSTFIQVHQSLSNLDRLRQTIYREKLIMFPAGQDMAGVQFEKQMRHQDPEEVYNPL
ncbi:hypothetical protein BU23DRAFT_570211 [Bimuria novae-zelandiae CBS 107.79]|uniref:Uncharacterized protein n=1 Tax=Bimuria novae-zelandiae CBS 107.79 TaxID=1447943 RepID=A0A6A5V124_9PLEO|nr:hypothetical protein BU23DRAFT_570211 [Bimuria novae-zelandiae CBS 107.79]